MSDELTPEEREALKNLPKERMPSAGLESRVVDAMRNRGFLGKRRRVIAITSGRVAGLVAACVALVVGGYSLGLQHGVNEEVLPRVEIMKSEAPVEEATPPAPAKEQTKPGAVSDETVNEQTAVEAPPAPLPKQKKAEATEEKSSAETPVVSAETAEQPSTPAAFNRSATPKSASGSGMPDLAHRSMTFLLDGARVRVELPDSARISQDGRTGIIYIYTSDGVIRILPADEN